MASSNPPEYLFEIGERVAWNKGAVRRLEEKTEVHVQDTFGNGPFKVSKIVPVPTACNCNRQNDEDRSHKENCDATARRRVGHSQIIYFEGSPDEEAPPSGVSGFLLVSRDPRT